MIDFNLTDNEIDTLSDIAHIIYEAMDHNKIEIEKEKVNRLLKIENDTNAMKHLYISDIYAIFCYMYWYINNDWLRNIPNVLMPNDEEKLKAEILRKKLHNQLRKKIISKFTYFDIENHSPREISEQKTQMIKSYLGNDFETIKANPVLKINITKHSHTIKFIYCKDEKVILEPRDGGYIIYQEEKAIDKSQ